MKNITGIILCGGKSCRFGEDKGLCTLAGEPMIQYPINALKGICDEIIISSNDERYKELGYKFLPDSIKNIGPIGGIYTALKESINDNNLIISCDMPFINEELLKYIIAQSENSLIAAAFMDNYVEPLCSYFNKASLPLIEEMIHHKYYKLQFLLNRANYTIIEIDNSLSFHKNHLFLNINTQVEYKKAETILTNKKKSIIPPKPLYKNDI